MLTQYEITHMENRMLVDEQWPDPDIDWNDEEVFEEDDIDEW